MEPFSAEKTAINTKDNMEINIERTKSILSHLLLMAFISSFIKDIKKEKQDIANTINEELNKYAETVLISPFLAVHSPKLLK